MKNNLASEGTNAEPNSNSRNIILPIFLTVFLDMVGIGVIIPVIPVLFFGQDTSFFAAGVSEGYKSILYGFLIAAYPLMQFFGAPVLGALSDRYGRKPMIMISLLGTLLGYLLFGWAIESSNLMLLFISRLLPGFMGGNISIILSAIADVSDEQSKAKNFGLVGMAFGLGFILGPALGGLLSDSSLVSWFDHATPFWFTAFLTALNILCVHYFFKETLAQSRNTDITFSKGLRNLAQSFSDARLRSIFTVVLLLSLGFSFFTQFFSVYLIQHFAFTARNTGILYGWIGLWLAITQGGLVRTLSNKKVAPSKILSITLLGLGIAICTLLLPSHWYWFFLVNPMIAIFQGLTSPNLTAEVSEQAGPARQGEILGLNQSMQSVGQIIPPIVAGYLNSLNGSLPILTGGILIILGWLIYLLFCKR